MRGPFRPSTSVFSSLMLAGYLRVSRWGHLCMVIQVFVSPCMMEMRTQTAPLILRPSRKTTRTSIFTGWCATKWLTPAFPQGSLLVLFFYDFENVNLIMSWWQFCKNPFRHSHIFIFGRIFSKFAHDVAYIKGLLTIENQQADNFDPKKNTTYWSSSHLFPPKSKYCKMYYKGSIYVYNFTSWTIIWP